MGLWDFMKNAGKALGIGDAEAAEAPAPEALKKEVEDLGLKAEGLKVTVAGDTVKLSGKAASQAEREKVILAVGNVAGVAKVEEAIETPEPNLGKGMQGLHGDFAREINIRHDRSGHVFQGRYGSKRVRQESHLWTTAAYIAANPVEAGMTPSAEAWPWASHRFAAADGPAPLWLDSRRLFELFESLGGDPRERYCELVRDRCAARAWVADEPQAIAA